MTNQELAVSLLPEIRTEVLNITWLDSLRDKKIVREIEDGIAYITTICPEGAALDFENATLERMLLENYVLYAESNATDDWRENYARDITTLKISKEVDDYALTESETTEEAGL